MDINMTRLKKLMNRDKNVDPKLIEKGKKYLARQLKTNEKWLEFMEVWRPGFQGRVFLQFLLLDPKHKQYGSTATYQLKDKDK
jgi:hypothetical protein